MILIMQLASLVHKPLWYFVFGGGNKSSLAQQFASEHRLPHLLVQKQPPASFKQHLHQGIVVECSATFFRQVEPLKPEIQVVFVAGQLTAEETHIKKDYQKIGRCVSLPLCDYKTFRKAIYPKLVVLYAPCPIQKRFLLQNYFSFSGYVILNEPLTANEMLSRLPKENNYVLAGFVPLPSELAVLEQYFDIQIVHLKHQRTELSNQEDFFNQEAQIVPELAKKPYFYTIPTSNTDLELAEHVGQALLPSLVFVNARDHDEKAGLLDYIEKNDQVLLCAREMGEILKRKGLPELNDLQRLALLVNVIWRSADRDTLFLTEFPASTEQFNLVKDKTRSLSLFADCLKPEKYEPTNELNPAMCFLQNHKRKRFLLDFSFDKQLRSSPKYLVLAGPAGVGKTTAAKYISQNYGYKHIEYQPYIASVKEKLITPEEGEELPFKKVIAHFAGLIAQSSESPLLIDGINIDWKDIDEWVRQNGPPIVVNLKTDEKELIRRGRKKREEDVNAEVSQQDLAKTKELVAKNEEWADQLTSRCPGSTLFQVDFTPQIILAERLLDDILRPRVFLVQDNPTTLYRNIAIRNNLGFYDLRNDPIDYIATCVRASSERDIVLAGYVTNNLASQDFYDIERKIGAVRYLAVWNGEPTEARDEEMKLEAPVKEEKPKPAEGEEGGEAPPAEQEGEAKKKELNIYDFRWTQPGNAKNLSQWFFKEKKNITVREADPVSVYKSFSQVIEDLGKNRDSCVYQKIVPPK